MFAEFAKQLLNTSTFHWGKSMRPLSGETQAVEKVKSLRNVWLLFFFLGQRNVANHKGAPVCAGLPFAPGLASPRTLTLRNIFPDVSGPLIKGSKRLLSRTVRLSTHFLQRGAKERRENKFFFPPSFLGCACWQPSNYCNESLQYLFLIRGRFNSTSS